MHDMKHAITGNSPFRPLAAALMLALFAACLSAQCSSVKIRKTYNNDGDIQIIDITDARGRKFLVSFSYDRDRRAIDVVKTSPPSASPLETRRIQYDAAGRVELVSYTGLVGEDRVARDAFIESYSFNRSGRLAKIEVSYKSAFSISKHKTALLTVRYSYRGGSMTGIDVNGGTFKKAITPSYAGGHLASVQYVHTALDWKKKQFATVRQLGIAFTDGKPSRVEDKSRTAPVTGRAEAERAYAAEGIDDLMGREEAASDYRAFLKRLESSYGR